MRASVYTFLFLLIFQAGAAPISRILEAEPTLDDDMTGSIATITNKDGDHCTATVLNENWLLTAAHCDFRKKDKIRVGRLRSEGSEDSTVKKVLNHPEYDFESGLHDIALVEVKEPLYSFYPIRLYFGRKYLSKYWAIAAGYGKSENAEDELNQKEIKIISLKSCKEALDKSDYKIPPKWKKKNWVCAGKDSVTCFGDSGGPLLVRSKAGYLVQVGVLMGGGKCTDDDSENVSAEKGIPNIYIAVSGYYKWILRSVTGTIRVVGNARKGKRGKRKQKANEWEGDEVF